MRLVFSFFSFAALLLCCSAAVTLHNLKYDNAAPSVPALPTLHFESVGNAEIVCTLEPPDEPEQILAIMEQRPKPSSFFRCRAQQATRLSGTRVPMHDAQRLIEIVDEMIAKVKVEEKARKAKALEERRKLIADIKGRYNTFKAAKIQKKQDLIKTELTHILSELFFDFLWMIPLGILLHKLLSLLTARIINLRRRLANPPARQQPVSAAPTPTSTQPQTSTTTTRCSSPSVSAQKHPNSKPRTRPVVDTSNESAPNSQVA
ncbi:hypothetical protein DXG01_002109 [Tephrocybe rancida]|nr:hypothetical protein DXG01_002109 [Tephrocybe rancida]